MESVVSERAADVKTCPNCGADIPLYQGYAPWCSHCDWNLQPEKQVKPKNRLRKLYDELTARRAKEVFERLSRSKSLVPGMTKSLGLAYAIAALVHLFTLLIVAAGIICFTFPGVIGFFLGLGMLAAAYLLVKPMFPYREKGGLPPEAAPRTYAFARRIAEHLHTRVDRIVIDRAFNASFYYSGWKRRNTLCIGLPLWEILTHEERVWLIAHELGHAVNGDGNRSWMIWSAVRALYTWYSFLIPDNSYHREEGVFGLVRLPLRVIGWVLAQLAWLLLRVLVYLLFDESQRAEYLADALGVVAGGSAAGFTALQKSLAGHSFALAVQGFTLNQGRTDASFFDYFRKHLAGIPAYEYQKLLRLEDITLNRGNSSHPPTRMRLGMIEKFPQAAPAIRAEEGEMDAIEREFAPLKAAIQKELMDAYLESVS